MALEQACLLLRRKKASFPQHRAPKRPLGWGNIHHTTIKGERWIVMVGLLDGKPYEVMGGLSNLIEIPRIKLRASWLRTLVSR